MSSYENGCENGCVVSDLPRDVFLVCMLIGFSKNLNRCSGQDFLPPKAVLALQCITFIVLLVFIIMFGFFFRSEWMSELLLCSFSPVDLSTIFAKVPHLLLSTALEIRHCI